MSEIEQLALNFLSLDQDKILDIVFRDKQLRDYVLSLIKFDQLFEKGVDETGRVIGYYSPATEEINPVKKAGTPYTLYDTGAFYRSIKVYNSKGELVSDADPDKGEDNLFDEFGVGIIGLTDENKEVVLQVIQENLLPLIQEKIFAGI